MLKALKVSTLQLTSKIKPQSAPQASDNNFEPLDRTVFIHIDNGLKKKNIQFSAWPGGLGSLEECSSLL